MNVKRNLSRRDFIRLTALAGTGLIAAACAPAAAPTKAPKAAAPTEAAAVSAPAATATTAAPAAATAATAPTATVQAAAQVQPVKLAYLIGDTTTQDWFTSYFSTYISGDNADKITVEPEYQKEATKVLQVKAQAGETPDLLSVGLPQEMIDGGKFVDLSGESWWSNLLPADKELSTDVKSGKNYFVALCTSAVGLYYNKDVFAELGLSPAKSWDDFVNNLQTIKTKKPDMQPFYMGGKDSWMLGHLLEYLVYGVAKQALGYVAYEKALAANDLASLSWNDSADGVIAAFAKGMMDLKAKGLINSNVVTATYDNQVEAFVTGKAAVISQGLWAMGDMKKKNPDFKAIGFMYYPRLVGTGKNIVGSPLDGGVSISTACKNLDAAKKVIAAMLQPEAIKNYCETRGSIPANPSVDANWSIIKDDVSKVLSEAAGVGWTQNLPGAFNSDEQGRLVQELFVNKYKTPVDFAKEFLKRWNAAYQAAQK